MTAAIPPKAVAWGMQLPVQSKSTSFAQPWETSAGPAELAHVVRAADRAGAFYVGVCDHIAVDRSSSEAMSTTWYDTVATLGWIAGMTESVHLLSHVYVLPYRHPLAVAKSFSTLDQLSAGRAILGAGAGHLETEFRALGLDHATRGRAVEPALEQIRKAFADEYVQVQISGETLEMGIQPRPVRPGGPPIWLGGSSRAAITRAALLGDGWLPQGPPKMGTRAAIEMIRELRSSAGLPAQFDLGVLVGPVHIGERRDGMDPHTLFGSPEEIAESLSKLPLRGMNQLQLRFMGDSAAEYADQVERFGAEVAPLLPEAALP